MTVTRTKATGTTTCKLCKCRIAKGDDQITFTGWFVGACVHGNKRKCKKGGISYAEGFNKARKEIIKYQKLQTSDQTN